MKKSVGEINPNKEDKTNMSRKTLLKTIFLISPSLYISSLIFFSTKFDSNPSSTSAIAYVLIPIYFALGLVPGYILSLLGKYIGEKIESKTTVKPLPRKKAIVYVLIYCVLIISIPAYIAHYKNEIYNKEIEPRVLIENKHIKKQDRIELSNELDLENWDFADSSDPCSEEYLTKIIDLEDNETIKIRRTLKYSFWNEQKVFLCNDDSYAYILKQRPDSLFSIILKQEIQLSSYVSRMKGFEIEFNNQKHFALLTVLRASLRRSVLTIYSPECEIVYQELTGRIRVIKPVEIINKKYLITGSERNPEYVYSWE